MRCACIDVGSNTTRLLVAEPDGPLLREIAAERVFTRIGAARDDAGRIPAATIADVARVVAAQARQASGCGAERLRAVATAAVRDAPNARDLCDAVREAAGIELEIVGPEEEAALAFLGATGTCPGAEPPQAERAAAERPVAVVDVGGGSTELVTGTPAGGVEWVVSLPVGSSILDLPETPCAADRLDALVAEVAAVFEDVAPPPVDRAVAVGGSAGSLRHLVGDALTPAALGRALDVLVSSSVAEVVERHGLHPERVRMLPAGLAILAAAGRTFGGAPLEVGRGGLREGVVLRELGSSAEGPRPPGARPPGG